MKHWPLAFLFDFDGVIVNSEPLHFWAYYQTLRQEKIELTEREYYEELVGMDDRGCIRHIFAKHNLPLEPATLLRVFTRKKEAMAEMIHQRQYKPLPGVEEFVRGVWRNYPLAIYSAALREEIETMLEGVALRDCFKVVISAEDVTRAKPDPQGYVMAMKLLAEKTRTNLQPADCLVVEDAPKVIKRVKAAGFATLAVTTSHGPEAHGDADYVVGSLDPDEVLGKIPTIDLLR